MEGTVRYRIEWAGGCCYLHADDDTEATEQGRDLAEDMGREVAVLAQEGDGWRCVGMVASELLVREELERLEALGL
jgi:ketosteroid isomerase-like protein